MKAQTFLDLNRVKVEDGFWTRLQDLVMDTVIPYQYDILEDRVEGVEKSHALENFRIAAGKSEGEFYGMVFQDSDVAKWLEAVAYALAVRPDPELEKKADEVIELIGSAQQPDGYLDTYFTVKEPDRKWQNLQQWHELYCNGHMIEAAVAFKEALGKDSLLKIMCRTADLICDRFGRGKIRGYPGHQEIELALLRLYRATGERRYLEQAQYFLDERGTEPDFFEEEAKARGVDLEKDPIDRKYAQDHAPVREQDKAVGHSVRAGYMYTAMADMASETGDPDLAEACRRIWRNIVGRRMFITGGVGSTRHGESYSEDYELPNDLVYAETCASVAIAFFARRMLELEVKGEYADILEKELYNGILSGMQGDGKRFFYVNPLEVVPGVSGVLPEYRHVLPVRPGWYRCACCPPNVARLVTSIGQYAWGEKDDTIYAHTYLGGNACFKAAGGVSVSCRSGYPWQGDVRYTVSLPDGPKRFTFAIHLPAWCRGWSLTLNGKPVDSIEKDGYLYLSREWRDGDGLCLAFPMEPRRIYANPRVRADAGCAALMRGPVVYCFEETDNGENLAALRLPRDEKISVEVTELIGVEGIPVLKAEGRRMTSGEELYSETPAESAPAKLTAVPYFMWGNRESGGMRVWILEQ